MRRNTNRRAALVNALEDWFERNQRPLPWRTDYDPYHILVAEMMLQQTRMEVVLDYFPRFIAKFPTVEALARTPEFEVLASWSGLGYYRRARMLRSAAIAISELHGGAVPDDEALLAKLPGIGRYTAGAVASIAFDRKAAVVEGNVTRLLARVDAIDAFVGSAALRNELWETAADLVALARSPRNFNQAMMEYGALVCRVRNPRCGECVIAKQCRGKSRAAELPARRQSPAAKRLLIALYLVSDSRGRILMRRESGNLMSGMFHLPHGDTSLLPGEVLDVDPGAPLGRFTHTVTNRRIEFVVHDAELRAGAVRDSSGEYRWVDPRALRSVPHPSYVKKALRLAGRI